MGRLVTYPARGGGVAPKGNFAETAHPNGFLSADAALQTSRRHQRC